MHMPLTHRLQVLIDEERHARLERLAAAGGVSVGSLVRDAIDRAFPDAGANRRQAADSILGAAPIPVDDWPDLKRRMIEEMHVADEAPLAP